MSKIMFHLNTLVQGGAERVVSNLANEFCKGDDEIIIATEWYGEDEFKLDERVRRIHVGLKDADENKSRIKIAVLRLKYLRDAIKKENPDVVIAFAQKAIYRCSFAAVGLKNPLIVCVRTNPTGHYDQPIDKVVLPLINKRADGAVFQTTGQRDFFPKHWIDISTIILNPVNDKYYLSDAVYENRKTTKTIVQHARVVDFKNQPMLVDAFMKVHEVYPEYDLKIYGPDSCDGTWEILTDKINSYGANDYIHLMGGSDELEKLVPEAELYAFSSDWEGLPNTLIEAMAMGMPIVATDCPCGGPRTVMPRVKDAHEILEDEYNHIPASIADPKAVISRLECTDDGILVPIMDEDAMAMALIYMIEHKEYALSAGQHARKIKDITNGPAIVKKWREYIDTVIAK